MTVVSNSRLWPARYRISDDAWLRCGTCPEIRQVKDLRQVEQVRRWAASSKLPEAPIEPRLIWVCREPDDACRHAQEKYCHAL